MKANTIAIIGAMEQEIELLKNLMHHPKEEKIGHFTFFCGRLFNKEVILSLSGIGKVNAAIATTLAIDRFKPDCVINTGSAGGLGEALQVGDVVVGTLIAHHDVDATAFGYKIGQVPKLRPAFESHADLVKAAGKAARAFTGARIHKGLIVSGDQFVHTPEQVAQIRKNFFGVQVVEMEAAAIAQTCEQFDVPFVIVRAVSDLADEKASMSFEEFLETAAVNSAKMVNSIIVSL
ncbi:MAG: 5'-methylthioadenosine/adenosylhomocysteine nucleosidase [Neisseria sp.]|uniref:5'-methylthioadenosine/adenosylhomocysteine nucleosidase n=1 Tax=Neisseria sp. TaxID=192066 RepID=UPI0026DD3845|nr:5'-methylthioadenosine/adenosylhomocysteine nucleosidase [Neisseria sp.]MDO4641565.1 5'-methylthioadenosine/adenosylhomocysteine nucleosidase [Neisseria sp.]